MQQRFNDLIKHDVKPFLAERGFAKKSLNFSKSADGLVRWAIFENKYRAIFNKYVVPYED
ncbi:hypothetical protein SAMN05216312_111114 [Cohnella sp. OV330]|uniref:hypothetical protein n=1 Tax=Cohnella sp. OV330 TaxID=1855288 RepID=UPI0008E16FB6|nr:hypothetical protein [Cohnella sp. OV330]SFB51884.1 hypothetical protein SAMN05216312_111114 [Cohnella sp. OV330]